MLVNEEYIDWNFILNIDYSFKALDPMKIAYCIFRLRTQDKVRFDIQSSGKPNFQKDNTKLKTC